MSSEDLILLQPTIRLMRKYSKQYMLQIFEHEISTLYCPDVKSLSIFHIFAYFRQNNLRHHLKKKNNGRYLTPDFTLYFKFFSVKQS